MELFDLNIHFRSQILPGYSSWYLLSSCLPYDLGRLRIPHIIGMILAGVVVGKYGFNILERDSSFELFGKVGLYYIMFWPVLRWIWTISRKQDKRIDLWYVYFPHPDGAGHMEQHEYAGLWILTSVLLASMYASHTLIAYPIISRYGLSRQRTVSITIGGTAVTVVLALMVLAVIGGMYKGEDVGGLFWVLLVAKVVLLFGLIIF